MLKPLSLCVSILLVFNSHINLAAEQSQPASTQLIHNALIIDGSGAAGFTGDLRFDKSGIIAIGHLKPLATDTVINAEGKVLAPGFIDTHSHHDIGLKENPNATAAISQGITTIVVGVDGSSNKPISVLKSELEEHATAVNIASYTGHGSLRMKAMGEDYKRKASATELEKMQAMLSDDLENGSLGLSTGLEYDPGIYSSTGEVIALAKTAAASNGRYMSHIRSEDREFHKALEELLSIGREAQLPVHISHIKLAATKLWGQAVSVVARLDKARAQGVDVTADIYPYTYWQSTLTVLLPDRNFNDLDAARFALRELAPADGLTLAEYAPDTSLVGKTVAQIATSRNQSNEETYLQLIRDAYEDVSVEEMGNIEELRESVIGVSMSEEDIAVLVKWPHANICSDGASTGHPRGYGAFPRAMRQFVREQNIVSLQEMIRKMTSLSASHAGIADRGLIKEGLAADLVLFEPNSITDNATIEHHDKISDGIEAVWVNGERVWRDRIVTGARPGVFISRGS